MSSQNFLSPGPLRLILGPQSSLVLIVLVTEPRLTLRALPLLQQCLNSCSYPFNYSLALVFFGISHKLLYRWRSVRGKVGLDQGQKLTCTSLIKGKGQGVESAIKTDCDCDEGPWNSGSEYRVNEGHREMKDNWNAVRSLEERFLEGQITVPVKLEEWGC